jgi:putative addiction module component (TIGR02574 family)
LGKAEETFMKTNEDPSFEDDDELSDEVKAELDLRLKKHRENPGDSITWEEFKTTLKPKEKE